MSSKYVKKLLAVTAEPLESSNSVYTKPVPIKKRKRAIRKLRESSSNTPLANASIQLRNLHVQTMLGLDERIKTTKKRIMSMTDPTKPMTTSTTTFPKLSGTTMVGNTRSSSSSAMWQQHHAPPTFRKQQYLRQKKEAKLKEMAIVLRKAKKEMMMGSIHR
jgi:hypothetical protein